MKKKGEHGLNIDPDFLDGIKRGEALWCPHCGQQASLKRHTANRGLVHFLYILDAYTLEHGEGFYKSTDIIPKTGNMLQKISTDAISTARYMQLILVCDDAVNTGGAPIGSYKLLPLAREFLMSKVSIPKSVFAYNACVVYTHKTQVMVSTAWKKLFDYAKDVGGIRADIQSGKGIPVL